MTSQIAVFLGRFSPLHLGHQRIIDRMIKDNGVENCLIIIGSSTSNNERTPYTFATRKKMIKTAYPKLRVIGIPDSNPQKEVFENKTLEQWITKLKEVERKIDAQFTFYGGSKKDIGYLSKNFNTHIPRLLTRNKSKLSATLIRKLLQTKNTTELSKYLDPKIASIVINEFGEFVKKRT